MLARLKFISAVGLLMFGLSSIASAATCKTYISSTVPGSTPVNTTTVALGPFTVNCSGSFGGSLTNTSRAWLTLQLEKEVNGVWTIVNSGYIAYSGTPGTYRYTVYDMGNGNGTWILNYNYPVF